jgi:hypothetical protein
MPFTSPNFRSLGPTLGASADARLSSLSLAGVRLLTRGGASRGGSKHRIPFRGGNRDQKEKPEEQEIIALDPQPISNELKKRWSYFIR